MIKRNLIFVFVCMFLFNFVSSEVYYEVNVYFEGDDVSLNSIDIVYSRIPLLNPVLNIESEYSIELLDIDGNVILSEDFDLLSFEISEGGIDNESFGNESLILEEGTDDDNFISEFDSFDSDDFVIYVPYFEGVSGVEIKKNGVSVLDIDDDALLASLDEIRDDGLALISNGGKGGSILFTLYLFLFVLIVVLASVIGYFYYTRHKDRS